MSISTMSAPVGDGFLDRRQRVLRRAQVAAPVRGDQQIAARPVKFGLQPLHGRRRPADGFGQGRRRRQPQRQGEDP